MPRFPPSGIRFRFIQHHGEKASTELSPGAWRTRSLRVGSPARLAASDHRGLDPRVADRPHLLVMREYDLGDVRGDDARDGQRVAGRLRYHRVVWRQLQVADHGAVPVAPPCLAQIHAYKSARNSCSCEVIVCLHNAALRSTPKRSERGKRQRERPRLPASCGSPGSEDACPPRVEEERRRRRRRQPAPAAPQRTASPARLGGAPASCRLVDVHPLLDGEGPDLLGLPPRRSKRPGRQAPRPPPNRSDCADHFGSFSEYALPSMVSVASMPMALSMVGMMSTSRSDSLLTLCFTPGMYHAMGMR